MAIYSFFVYGEGNISLTGTRVVDGVTVPKTLDGLDQGDGSHLVGETLTINTTGRTEIFVDDNGSETNFADNDGGQSLDADVTIDGVTFTAGAGIEAEYQFVLRDPDGNLYTAIAVNINNSSPSFATIEAITFVDIVPPPNTPLEIISASEGPSNGGPGAIDESRLVPCFCEGTLISTDRGPQPVETLSEGDRILRADQTFGVLRRVFTTTVSRDELRCNPRLYPVRIVAGALGKDLPERDLLVSRQHRMLMSSNISERMFGVRDVLIPAIKLTALPGIYVEEDVSHVTYVHLLFDQHEVIFAEGAPTESLFTGPEALSAISPEAKQEILTLFPEIADIDYRPEPARFIPSGRQQKQAIARHLKNQKPVLM
ncbi:Hint domain-containing protein [Loktanella sp. PT4BL]|uniref:Hint domain-containing protein n=1 Tax=Loktanella sp. PT4BL TaxID=2135611 RepID=UPI000D8D6C65|nr:Hint domain-containing protein [Loktanella sp. PT4BL]PXW72578.1 Hint domain-containing protein [Loktanella sp. PT4BL]